MLPMPGNVFYGFVFPSDIPDAYLDVFEKHLSDTCNFRISQSQTSQAQPETVPPQSSSQELVVRQPSNNALAVKTTFSLFFFLSTNVFLRLLRCQPCHQK